uniref:Uncharacterized protein n=1 Tax=Oryza rufipogon TaxID=4529 RepID=A0A0E0Q6N0_ORYRU
MTCGGGSGGAVLGKAGSAALGRSSALGGGRRARGGGQRRARDRGPVGQAGSEAVAEPRRRAGVDGVGGGGGDLARLAAWIAPWRLLSSGGKVLGEEEKAAENIYIKCC